MKRECSPLICCGGRDFEIAMFNKQRVNSCALHNMAKLPLVSWQLLMAVSNVDGFSAQAHMSADASVFSVCIRAYVRMPGVRFQRRH
jgi:hypothetical protein